jgi:hypothetical protein
VWTARLVAGGSIELEDLLMNDEDKKGMARYLLVYLTDDRAARQIADFI